MPPRLAALFIFTALLVGVTFAVVVSSRPDDGGMRACTEEAKICPDGSAVGRTGPNCEFAKCPGEEIPEGVGVLQGRVDIGPVCPVEREGVPCVVSPETYTSRTLVVYEKKSMREVASSALNVDGTYSFALPPGVYILDMKRVGIDGSGDLPREFDIAAGFTTVYDISIDTGIR